MKVAGVDDAGRGPVIGPLVIAGVVVDEKNLLRLKDLGVKDSKVLSPHRREELAKEIKKLAIQLHVVKLLPSEIDYVVEKGRKLHKLNRLEAHAMAEVIATLRPDVAYVDASDVLTERFREHIEEKLPFKIRIVSEHKADSKYVVVSAASIIAKVERDQAVAELASKYGDIGSGYISDPKTVEFLKKWVKKYGSYPDFVRKSWKPAKRLKEEAGAKQTKLK
jgi:ribonuclease HII